MDLEYIDVRMMGCRVDDYRQRIDHLRSLIGYFALHDLDVPGVKARGQRCRIDRVHSDGSFDLDAPSQVIPATAHFPPRQPSRVYFWQSAYMYLAYLSTTYLLPKEGNTHDLTYHLIRPSFVSGQKYTQSHASIATKSRL